MSTEPEWDQAESDCNVEYNVDCRFTARLNGKGVCFVQLRHPEWKWQGQRATCGKKQTRIMRTRIKSYDSEL